MSKLWTSLIPILAALSISMIPTPTGLEPYAWHYFSIFVGVVLALILEPIPAAAVGLLGVVLCASLMLVPAPPEPAKTPLLKAASTSQSKTEPIKPELSKSPTSQPEKIKQETPKPETNSATPPTVVSSEKKDVDKKIGGATPAAKSADKQRPKKPTPADEIRWALAGFSNSTVWLIFTAFMFALGYEKTGLGKRIALVLIRLLGKRTLGLGYAVALADLALAPFMPSNTARSGGTIFPIIKNIPGLYNSSPDNEPRKIGGYLMWTALATTSVTSSMFLTGLAPNLLAVSLTEKTIGLKIGWMEWFTAFAPVGIVLFIAVPWLAYILYPPTLKTSDDAPRWAADELRKLGPFSGREFIMAALAVLALIGWIFTGEYLDATLVALIALTLMILTDVISWDDIIGLKPAWNVLVWFATLVTLADGLAKVGFLKWFATLSAKAMVGYQPSTVMILLVILFFVMHYLFASSTAHVTALLPVFLTTASVIPGINMRITALLLCLSLGLLGIITPYATGPSPIYYGSGYIGRRDFWVQGFIFGTIFLAALILIGVPYLMSIAG